MTMYFGNFLRCFIYLLLAGAISLNAMADDAPKQPRIVGDWWQVAGNPDLGELTHPKQQPVDFGVWQADDGTWQLWSCIRGTREAGKSRLFYRWEGAKLTDANWKPMGIAMRADPKTGELAGGLQAPYVFKTDSHFEMYYGGWEDICSASSTDGKKFERRLNSDGKATLFRSPDGFAQTRDPMLLRVGDLWHCYYTAHTGKLGADFCRTSKDLHTWSEARTVAAGGQSGSGSFSAECPFVVELEPGQFYLFRTQRYGANAQTRVYFSRNPLDFGVDHDEGHFVCTLPIAAPEIINYEGQYYIAALLPSLKGIQIVRLEWAQASVIDHRPLPLSPADGRPNKDGNPVMEPPVIPVGLDAYRQWERWPYQRIGVRAYMRSTYDRRGGNEGADASHFLYQLADDYNVTLDVEGAGVLCFARYNHWHGSPWHYVVDGRDHLVQESSTANPNQPVRDSVFIPEALFPAPLSWTWSITQGADLNWVPIPFEKSFRMAYSRTRYGTGYYIYQQFVGGIPLSRPIQAWDNETPPDKDVLDLIRRAGTDLAPLAGMPDGVQFGAEALTLGKDETLLLHKIAPEKPAMLRALEISAPRDQAIALGRARLRVTWDDLPHPSIETPVALFFGSGTLYNRDGREYLVKAFPVHVRFDAQRVHLACYFPMPFFRSAKIELLGNATSKLTDLRWSVRCQPFRDPPEHVGYFHATYRDHPNPEPGHDLVLLDTRQTEAGGDWSGQIVGTSFIFSDRAYLGTLEGDPRFFFDDSQTPQAQGTGTEEWGGGGDYWGGQNMTLPFAGHPVGARDEKSATNAEDKIESAYRFLLADLMPFGKNALIRLEHGGVNDSTEHYQTVTYWYGRSGASLVKTDELKIGDTASEAAHRYISPQASEPYEITSRYEWGPDTLSNGGDKPLAKPADYADFEFDATAGKSYAIWVRGKNLDGKNSSDSFWIQFDDDIGTPRLGPGHSHPKGFGNWLDRFPAGTSAWSSALPQDPPQTVTFARDGRHRLRIQPRHPRHTLETIWLSMTQKTLPPPSQSAPAASRDEIILNPADAVAMKGRFKLNEDHTLDIDGLPESSAVTVEVYPAHTDHGRKTAGTSEFSLKLDPQNIGVMLRRKLDYQYPNQRAEVFIADEHGNSWKSAGIWYLAGSSTCVYSNPKEELGATQHHEQTSNRRFRDDEFLVPRDLTEGRAAIRVRVRFAPVNIPLFPGRPLAEQAWTELRYDAYCFVLR